MTLDLARLKRIDELKSRCANELSPHGVDLIRELIVLFEARIEQLEGELFAAEEAVDAGRRLASFSADWRQYDEKATEAADDFAFAAEKVGTHKTWVITKNRLNLQEQLRASDERLRRAEEVVKAARDEAEKHKLYPAKRHPRRPYEFHCTCGICESVRALSALASEKQG